jgi:DNA-binding NarL/FixJ family response regulator
MKMHPLLTLLVEDHIVVREGIRLLLEMQPDIQVIGETGDGKEAVCLVEQLHPHVVVMDVGLNGQSGLEATCQIRQNHPEVHVVILSAEEDRVALLRLLQVGAYGYLPKKAAGSELIHAIRAVCRGEAYIHPSMTRCLMDGYVHHAKDKSKHLDGLTGREVEILKLIAEGLTNQVIATQLFLSVKTVEGHRGRIMEKLDVHNRTALVRYAINKGLITP